MTSTPRKRLSKFLNLRVNATVVDPVKLIKHARSLWEEDGGKLETAPTTVEQALVVAMATHADGTPPAEFGVRVAAECKTSPSVFHKINQRAIGAIIEEERQRFTVSETPRRMRVEVGADYFHRGTVEVEASSLEEAERLALKKMGDVELKVVEQVEATAFARVLT